MSSVAFLGPKNASNSLAAGASTQTPLRELKRSPNLLAGIKGPTSKGNGGKERGTERKGTPK